MPLAGQVETPQEREEGELAWEQRLSRIELREQRRKVGFEFLGLSLCLMLVACKARLLAEMEAVKEAAKEAEKRKHQQAAEVAAVEGLCCCLIDVHVHPVSQQWLRHLLLAILERSSRKRIRTLRRSCVSSSDAKRCCSFFVSFLFVQ